MSGTNEIDKPTTVADLERVLGHKMPSVSVLKRLFAHPTSQPTEAETCKWKNDGIGWANNPHVKGEIRFMEGTKYCPTCGKRIEVEA